MSLPVTFLPRTFQSLSNRNFRIFWFAQIFPLMGWWMQSITLNWMVYQLTKSTLMLGVVSLVSVLPVGIISLLGGVVSDRLPRKKLIMATQSIMATQALVLAALVLTDMVQIWHIMLMTFIQSAADAIEQPARYSLINDLVGREDFANAVALNSSVIQAARIIGPALAGLVVSQFGEGFCFLFTCLGNIIFIVSFSTIKSNSTKNTNKPIRMKSDFWDGMVYIFKNQAIRNLLILFVAPVFLAQPFLIILPAFATDVLHTNSLGYGVLLSATGIGAVCGALLIASLKPGKRGLILIGADIVFAIALILFSLSRFFILSVIILFFVGMAQIMQQTLTNLLIQLEALNEYQGRVMSIFYISNNGFFRLGGMQAGAISSMVGSPGAILIGAVLSLLWGFGIVWLLPNIRKIQ